MKKSTLENKTIGQTRVLLKKIAAMSSREDFCVSRKIQKRTVGDICMEYVVNQSRRKNKKK